MARHIFHISCGAEDCAEATFFVMKNYKEYTKMARKYSKEKWLCARHRNPEQTLKLDNLYRRTELVSMRSRFERLRDYFWNGENGSVHGPGFLAYSKDFPPGTKIIIEATIILPSDESE